MIIGAGVAALLVALLIIWWRQERITFQPPPPPFDDAGDTRRLSIPASDGTAIFGYVVGDSTARGILIAFHGNADLAVWQIPWAREVARRSGWQVMLVEYRGYGGNAGSPSYGGVQQDARGALAAARTTLGVDPERIAYFGHSLGSAVATELAAESAPVALLLQSPFTSARDMARIIVARPIALIWNLMSRVHYDTVACVASLSCPVYVAHGDRDRIVPARMGRGVYAAAANKGALLIVSGAGHNDVAVQGGNDYWRWLVDALSGPTAR
jgi:fermentation-respiration switch protein FrsA (DUF1100 family)